MRQLLLLCVVLYFLQIIFFMWWPGIMVLRFGAASLALVFAAADLFAQQQRGF